VSRTPAAQQGAAADVAQRVPIDGGSLLAINVERRPRHPRRDDVHGCSSEPRRPTEICNRPPQTAAVEIGVCAGHGTELTGCKSPCQVFAQPKARRRARASPRGGVWRKPNPKMRGDEQEPDTRCGTPGTSGHVTVKSSMRAGVCFINPASTHRKFCVLLREVCMVSTSRVGMK
jgi:hypothetical protein